jgi:hypothetical protein
MEDNLKRNMVALFKLFENKPNLLSKYLLSFDILTEKTKRFINNNDNLKELADEIEKKGEFEKPFFSNIDEMYEFYDKFFKNNGKIDKKNKEFKSSLDTELQRAIENEDYETAAKIKKILDKK